MSDFENFVENLALPETKESATEASVELLAEKSRKRYEKQYEDFVKWCSEKKTEEYTENVLLAYFYEKSKLVKASTLWTQYSMVKTMLVVRNNVDISKYPKLLAFLKKQNDGYKPTKSRTLTEEQVEQFLTEAPDNEFLMAKVALILGIAGACRGDEFTNLSTNDVQDLGSSILFNIKNTKKKIDRIFLVKNSERNSVDFVKLCKKYMSLRKNNTEHSRFFVQYKNHICTSQPVGKNTFGKLPQRIASFLNLPDASLYTGHCFRRTSASLLADAGAEDVLKRRSQWKSSVAEGEPKLLSTSSVFLPEASTTSFDSGASTSNGGNIINETNFSVGPNFTRIKNETDEGNSNSAVIIPSSSSSSSSLPNAPLKTYGASKNRMVCRFCLQNVNKENCTSLQFLQNSSSAEKKVEKSMEIKSMIKLSFPNLDLNLTSAPVICDLCTSSLTSTYIFISQTMLNQNTIKTYMTENCIAGEVNLDDVVNTNKRRIDEEIDLVVKKLKQSQPPEKISQATKQSKRIRKLKLAAEVERIDNIISDEENSSDVEFVEFKMEPEDEYMGTLEYSDCEQDFIKEEVKVEPDYVDYKTIHAYTEESTSGVGLNSNSSFFTRNPESASNTSTILPKKDLFS